jgi:hypothetical protein
VSLYSGSICCTWKVLFSSKIKVTVYQLTRYKIHTPQISHQGRNTSNSRVHEIIYLKKIFGPKRDEVMYRFLASVCTHVEFARGNSSMVCVTPRAGSVTVIKQVVTQTHETKCPAVFL